MVKCPQCPKKFKSHHGVGGHVAKVHGKGRPKKKGAPKPRPKAKRKPVPKRRAPGKLLVNARPVRLERTPPNGAHEPNEKLITSLRAQAKWHRDQADKIDERVAGFEREMSPYLQGAPKN
jgi:uncharacterized C2H2 Zn-finger protein